MGTGSGPAPEEGVQYIIHECGACVQVRRTSYSRRARAEAGFEARRTGNAAGRLLPSRGVDGGGVMTAADWPLSDSSSRMSKSRESIVKKPASYGTSAEPHARVRLLPGHVWQHSARLRVSPHFPCRKGGAMGAWSRTVAGEGTSGAPFCRWEQPSARTADAYARRPHMGMNTRHTSCCLPPGARSGGRL